MDKNLEKAIMTLNEQVSSFNDEQYKKFLTGYNTLSINEHKYSPMNRAMISSQLVMQGLRASLVGGYKSFWSPLGRYPKKGSRALWILMPLIKKSYREDINGEKESYSFCFGFKFVRVFDYSQTEGKEIEKKQYMVTKNASSLKMSSLIDIFKEDVNVEFRAMEPLLGGFVEENNVVINSLRTEDDQLRTYFHELAHFYLDHTKEHNVSKDQREVDAETVAHLVSQEYGITGRGVEYIYGYSHEHNIRPQIHEVIRVASDIIKKISKVA